MRVSLRTGRATSDGRRVELTLTPLGETVQRRVKTELAKLVTRRLASYTREQALLFGRMLHDFGSVAPEGGKLARPHRRGSVRSIVKQQIGE